MKAIYTLAKNAFLKGNDFCGERVIGYDKSGLQKHDVIKNHYTFRLRIKDVKGNVCYTSVGFDVVIDYYSENKDVTIEVTSGSRTTSIPLTTELMQFFPNALWRNPINKYSIEEIEAYLYERKEIRRKNELRELEFKVKQLSTPTPAPTSDWPF